MLKNIHVMNIGLEEYRRLSSVTLRRMEALKVTFKIHEPTKTCTAYIDSYPENKTARVNYIYGWLSCEIRHSQCVPRVGE